LTALRVTFSVKSPLFIFKSSILIGLVIALIGSISALEYGDYQRISVSAEGTQGNQTSGNAVMSADGNLILFESYADNLTPEGDYGYFLYNRQTDTLEHLDIDPVQATFYQLRLSASGRYLLYETGSALTTSRRVWLHDFQTDTDVMVTKNMAGGEPNHGSAVIDISGDGRYAVFASNATDLVASMAGCNQLFVRDTVTDTTVCVPMGAGQGVAYNFLTAAATLSEDGSKLYYGAPDTVCCAAYELFVYDLAAQTTTPIDITFDDEPCCMALLYTMSATMAPWQRSPNL
jgi:Tol biopolymer transport system component